MKKNLMIIALIAGTAFSGFSQKKNVTSAIMLARKNQFVKAKPFIDKAIESESTKNQAKTWVNKAKIYAGIAGMKTAAAKKIQGEMDVQAIVVEAMMKTKALDKDGEFKRDLLKIAGPMYNNSLNGGIEAYNAKDYKKAFGLFSATQQYASILGINDSVATYNAGMSAGLIENYEAAVTNYKKCITLNYGGADVYLKLAESYKKLGKNDEAKATLAEAKTKYSTDPAIVLNEAQMFIDAKEFDKAKSSIESALKNDPNNFQLQYASAIIYSNMESYDESISAYERAIELKPEMDELKSDLIVMQYNKIVTMNEAMNNLDLSETAKYDKIKGERDAFIKEMLPKVEERYKKDSSASMKRILNTLYGLTGQNEKRIK